MDIEDFEAVHLLSDLTCPLDFTYFIEIGILRTGIQLSVLPVIIPACAHC